MSHELGQYFTTNLMLKETVFEMILNNPDNILEPSIGQGDLVDYVTSKLENVKFDMYEIDSSIKRLKSLTKLKVTIADFLKVKITKKYKTIIGNPPYVKGKRNLYIDFIEKCYGLLEDLGELIFIVPSDFLKLTSASKLLDTMLRTGTLTHVNHPNNEKLFLNASIDVIVFRYVLGLHSDQTMYNETLKYVSNTRGVITFTNTLPVTKISFGEYFSVHVGMVTGKEKVFKNKIGNIKLIVSDSKFENYIYITEFPSDNSKINSHLLKYKTELLERKIKKFNETNWFEWGAPRNIKKIESDMGKECIYVHTLTRNKTVAFKGVVGYFGGNLLMIVPTKPINLDRVVNYLNSASFTDNFMFSGRFKLGHKCLQCSIIDNECLRLI